MEKVIETSQLFDGLNDFRSFMAKASNYPNKITRRTMDVKISKGFPVVIWPEGNILLKRNNRNYEYWNFIFKSEGFLYNQVSGIIVFLRFYVNHFKFPAQHYFNF